MLRGVVVGGRLDGVLVVARVQPPREEGDRKLAGLRPHGGGGGEAPRESGAEARLEGNRAAPAKRTIILEPLARAAVYVRDEIPYPVEVQASRRAQDAPVGALRGRLEAVCGPHPGEPHHSLRAGPQGKSLLARTGRGLVEQRLA